MSENCGREQDTIFLVLLCDKICYLPTYRKLPKISPGAYIFQRPFLRGLFLEGLIFGGAYLRREICVSTLIGLAFSWKEIYRFCFVLLCIEGNFQVQAPRTAFIWRGDLTECFLRYEFGGAYIWWGLYMEGLIFEILKKKQNSWVSFSPFYFQIITWGTFHCWRFKGTITWTN